jgi:hypothetical protein
VLRWIVPVGSSAELFEPLFKLALFCSQPRGEDLIDLELEGPQLIDGHRLKVLSVLRSRCHKIRLLPRLAQRAALPPDHDELGRQERRRFVKPCHDDGDAGVGDCRRRHSSALPAGLQKIGAALPVLVRAWKLSPV